MKVTLKEVREIIREELELAAESGLPLNENIGFPTARPKGLLPESYEDFRKCFAYAFTKLHLNNIAGKSTNLHESNSVIDGLEAMWHVVDNEKCGRYGMPGPVFKEGKEFWEYYASEFESSITKIVETQMPGAKLAKGNSAQIAKNILEILGAGA